MSQFEALNAVKLSLTLLARELRAELPECYEGTSDAFENLSPEKVDAINFIARIFEFVGSELLWTEILDLDVERFASCVRLLHEAVTQIQLSSLYHVYK